MKADVKAQWLADLRSGQFEQGHGFLETVDTDGTHYFCCLGVLCRQAVRAGVIPEPELHSGEYRYLDDTYGPGGNTRAFKPDPSAIPTGEAFNQKHSLPRKVSEWAGLDLEVDADDVIIQPVSADEPELSAIGANDAERMTFAEIADLVEQNVPAE